MFEGFVDFIVARMEHSGIRGMIISRISLRRFIRATRKCMVGNPGITCHDLKAVVVG